MLQGEEVSVRLTIDGSPAFTVGVPFSMNGTVLGAVLIRTPAQVIEGGLGTTYLRIAILALAAAMLAAVSLLIYVRRVLRPLRQVTDAARSLAAGDFSVRVPTEHTGPETRELAAAFDLMADRIADTERSRREFVANVSHELRSPITSISGFVQGMRDGVIPPEEHGYYLGIVADETDRLSKLIGQLLALSRL